MPGMIKVVDNFLTSLDQCGVIINRQGREVRKIKKNILVIIPVLLILNIVVPGGALAYADDSPAVRPMPSLINPLEYLNENLLSKLPGIKSEGSGALPSGLGGLLSEGGGLGGIKLLNTSSLSTNDIPGALKSIAVLAINLFLIVIQTVAGVLKALLPFLQ